MNIYLVQHGKALPKEIDTQKGLSDEGVLEVERVGDRAFEQGLMVAQILHSGKKRARQTAEIFKSRLKVTSEVLEKQGMNPLDDVVAFARDFKFSDHLMLVGHLPFMERLASYLMTGEAGRRLVLFQNGGVVCLAKEAGRDNWLVKWALPSKLS